MRRNKLAAFLSAGCMAFAMASVPAKAVNLHDELFMSDAEKQIKEYCDIAVNATNNERLMDHFSELATFPALNEVTCLRAEEIALPGFFSHMRPDGDNCFSALKQAGISYSTAGENIAANRPDPVSTVQQWMDSLDHKSNILNPDMTHVGIGYYLNPNYDASNPQSFMFLWSMFLIARKTGGIPAVIDGQYIPTRDYGDADGSHEINAADATFILKYAAAAASGNPFQAPTYFMEAADVNQDGTVDALDAAIILEYSADAGAGKNVELSSYVW